MTSLPKSPETKQRTRTPAGLVLVDDPRSGAENMALDQRMLERAEELGQTLLRVYQWAEPTLSLGYFQKYAERLEHQPSCDIACVRRATGGGAIVHHHDWTYSVAVPNQCLEAKRRKANPAAGNPIGASQQIYDCIHDAVVRWLHEWDLPASRVAKSCQRGAEKCSFLCFERRSEGDVILSDYKVMGSAQRRHRGALLQHGSLLLSKSPHAPTLPGLQQLATPPSALPLDTPHKFAMRLQSAVSALIGEELLAISDVHELVGKWKKESLGKYGETTWIGMR